MNHQKNLIKLTVRGVALIILAGALLLGNSGPPASAVNADAATPHVEAVQQWQAELSAATPQTRGGFQTSKATVNGQPSLCVISKSRGRTCWPRFVIHCPPVRIGWLRKLS